MDKLNTNQDLTDLQCLANEEPTFHALRRALEIIAVGDSKDPVGDAAETLVELGLWRELPPGFQARGTDTGRLQMPSDDGPLETSEACAVEVTK